jgi:phosphate starvation-inducible protein PhoH
MKYAIEHISDLDEVSITTFTDEDIVRNPIIGKILDKWKN